MWRCSNGHCADGISGVKFEISISWADLPCANSIIQDALDTESKASAGHFKGSLDHWEDRLLAKRPLYVVAASH